MKFVKKESVPMTKGRYNHMWAELLKHPGEVLEITTEEYPESASIRTSAYAYAKSKGIKISTKLDKRGGKQWFWVEEI